jgi:hypothetical protein
MHYLRRHWRGDLSLARSFWVNVVLVNLAILLLTASLYEGETGWEPVVLARVTLGLLAFQLFLLTPWQIVGCWRSAGRRTAETGKPLAGALVKGVLVFGLISTVGHLSTESDSYRQLYELALPTPSADPKYTVTILPDKKAIEVRGEFDSGLTAEVRRALQRAPGTTALLLESNGGYVSEGERLGALIEREGLDTFSFHGCHSACTLAFIGGDRRYLGPAASLGFHQYSGLTNDPEAQGLLDQQQRQAQRRFRERGVSPAFTARMFRAGREDFWYPSHDLLRGAGVIEGILPRSELAARAAPPSDADAQRRQMEEELAEYSGFSLLRKYEPEAYEQLVAEVFAQVEAGATLAEATHAASDVLMAAVGDDLPRAQPATLALLLGQMRAAIASLRTDHPYGCLQAFFPDRYGQLDYSRYVPMDTALGYQEVLGLVLRDARENPASPPDPALVETATRRVIGALGPHRGNLLPENPQGRADYERSCDAILAFLDEILALPSPEREAMVQGIFQ